MSRQAIFIAAVVLAVVSFLHLMRVFYPVPIVIASTSIPVWLSAVIFVVAGCISAFLFRAARKLK